jgi:hypothetical protein
MAWLGMAWLGLAWLGLAWLGLGWAGLGLWLGCGFGCGKDCGRRSADWVVSLRYIRSLAIIKRKEPRPNVEALELRAS